MRAIAKLDGQKIGRTLADLDDGVVARVRLRGGELEFIRWRDGINVLGPRGGGSIMVQNGTRPEQYEIIEVFGKLTISFEPD